MNSKLKMFFLVAMEIIAFVIGLIGFIFLILGLSLFIMDKLEVLESFIALVEKLPFLSNFIKESMFFSITFGPLVFFLLSSLGIFFGFISCKFTKKSSAKFAFFLNAIDLILSLIVGVIVLISISKAAW
jgi:hypothetical protein